MIIISGRGVTNRWLLIAIASIVLMTIMTIHSLEIGREKNEEIYLNNEVRDNFKMKRLNNVFYCLKEIVGS